MKMLVLATFVLLAACGTTQGAGAQVRWRCDGGASFSVNFNESGDIAHVFADGQTYRLPVAISASGARFAEGGVEYWEHQGSATLTGAQGGPYANCRRS